jgi:hypothetical protein
MTNQTDRVIRASEVGSYVYCARAWWLGAVEGMAPQDTRRLESGSATHEGHGRRVLFAGAMTRLSHLLLVLAGLVGAIWLMSGLAG